MNRQKKSFSSFEKTSNLSPKPSRLLFIYLLLAHIAAAVAIFLSPISVWCSALFLLSLLASWLLSIKSVKKTVQLQLNSHGEWLFYTTDKQWVPVKLSPSTRSFASIILLVLQDKNRRSYRILLLPDSISATSFRQLKARLILPQQEQDSVI